MLDHNCFVPHFNIFWILKLPPFCRPSVTFSFEAGVTSLCFHSFWPAARFPGTFKPVSHRTVMQIICECKKNTLLWASAGAAHYHIIEPITFTVPGAVNQCNASVIASS